MSTINISLTSDQVKHVDVLQTQFGFANRSEFFRALLRYVLGDTAKIAEVARFPFSTPSVKSRKEVLANFKKTKRYSAAFLKDLEKGLKQSSYFNA